uniref:BLOC-2 complex member HPS6 n=1 Tax=Doryrhamphus excisus TaxID=161450 RepID=UPI0025AE0295|nr:BLOC-2 complex member HPS6 [Doryrhamphus excisus]
MTCRDAIQLAGWCATQASRLHSATFHCSLMTGVMSRFVLEKLSDFGDYAKKNELHESLNSTNVRLSPDGRHVHVILSHPKLSLVTVDKYERPQLVQNPRTLDLCSTRGVPIVDIIYLDNNDSSSKRDFVSAAVVYKNGRTEFWKFQECKGGWSLLQTSDLCNSPRANVVSVCACSNLIIWCEERPPSESSPVLSSARSKLRYCVCRRDYELEEGAVILGGVKIALHNNPKFTVISSGQYVHLLPASPLIKFFLSWCPRRDSFRVGTTCKATPLKKLDTKESDLRKLITDCLGYVSSLNPPEICDVSPSACGGLLLLLDTGWVCLLQNDGLLRRIYKLADNCPVKYVSHTSFCTFDDTLVLLVGQKLHLIDMKCGRELETVILKTEGVLFVKQANGSPHLFSETALHKVVQQEMDTRDLKMKSTMENICPGALLAEAVFEEACKYYQQRSLSSTQLTVDALKKEGRFQAPISLASILRDYLSSGPKQKASELIQNGGCTVGKDKLKVSLEPELKALVAVEELKGTLVRGGVKDVEALCESLMEKEIARLLSNCELDHNDLVYLNSIFSVFPCQAWRAAQAALQLHYNGEASLSSRAPPDVWKSVLSPTPSFPGSLTLANGGSQHRHSPAKADHNANCTSKSTSATSSPMPIFELLCHSVLRFQPTWLPGFLELGQQQQGSAGLGLSLAASTWSENNMPLYKRALAVLSSVRKDGDQHQELEVELLMVSGRPNAILQALRILIGQQQWERVTQVAQKFCKQSPLLNKEIFTTLLCEVTQHRDLDPYLDLLWALCPEDLTVTTILNLVLKNLPLPSTPQSPSSLPMSLTSNPHSSSTPFADPQSGQLTIGLLKPLLRKVLQRETKPSQRYADILQSPSFPPPAPPRLPMEQSRKSVGSPPFAVIPDSSSTC